MGSCICKSNNLDQATLDNTKDFTMLGRQCKVKVIDVYDGDTVTVAFPFQNEIYHKKCRIEGIDCAEIRTKNLVEKKFGYEARDYLITKLQNKIVDASFEKQDKYGRLLAVLSFENGENVAQHMIDQGYGYRYNGEKKFEFNVWFDTDKCRAKTEEELQMYR